MKTRGENRNGYHAGIRATPKRGNEFESASVEKQGAISRLSLRRDCCSDGTGAQFKIFVSEAGFFRLSVGKIAKRKARAVLRGSCAEQFNQIVEGRVTIVGTIGQC